MIGRLIHGLASVPSSGMADATAAQIPLTWNEALSGMFGSISLACWIFVFIPQLWENFVSKSAAGLSAVFVIIWLVGDVANLAGAILAGLVPTVIAIAVWYLIAEAALIWQIIYYGHLNARKDKQKHASNGDGQGNGSGDFLQPERVDESAPLLRNAEVDVPGSRRTNSTPQVNSQAGVVPALDDLRTQTSSREGLKTAGAVLAVFLLGAGGWAIAYASGAWKPTAAYEGGDELNRDRNTIEKVAMTLGYISAVCYLGARIPQIIKNYREKSCEGLSILFFILSLSGNLTFGAQIFFHSIDRRYIIVNLPWLLGSLGTIFEDLTIFAQFRLYKKSMIARNIE